MEYSISEGAWLFRRFDTKDEETPFRFRFLRWVRCGDRDDFAAIEIVDPWANSQGVFVSRAFLAARHVGVDLRALGDGDIPAHVHILLTAPEMLDAIEIDANSFRRDAWATIEPVDWRSTHPVHSARNESGLPILFQRRQLP